MSERVEIQLPNGDWELRTDLTIEEHERTYPMRCCDTDDNGNVCHATMHSVRKTKPKLHIEFRQTTRGKPHIPGCRSDRRRAKKVTTTHDDCADGYTLSRIMDIMDGKDRKEEPPKEPGGGGPGVKPGFPPKEPVDPGPDNRPIEVKVEQYKTPASLAKFLLGMPLEHTYAGVKVGDFLIDNRTVQRFREEGIPDGAGAMVIAKKLVKDNRDCTDVGDDFVFADCEYKAAKGKKAEGCLHFRVNLKGKEKTELFDLLKETKANTPFVLFFTWIRDPNNRNTYIALNPNLRRIGTIAPEDMKKE